MVDPKLGTKRVCESCGAKFYDLNKQPVTCPKCGHAFDPMAAFVKTEPVREIKPAVEEEDEEDELESKADEISLDDMDDGMGDDDDDDDADDETQALAEFDDDDALLDDDDEDDEDGFLEDEDDDD